MELKLAPGNNHEKAPVDHAVTLQQVTYGLTTTDLRKLASDIAETGTHTSNDVFSTAN